MNIGEMLKTVGSSLFKNALPPLSGIAYDLINRALPDGKKLSEDSTGIDVELALGSLPPEQRVSLLEKKLDVEMTEIKEWSGVVTALAEVDKVGKSTRPGIAKDMSTIIGFSVIITLSPIAYAIVTGDSKMIDSISSSWPLIMTVIGIPAGIVNSYFGKRQKEKCQKYEAVTNTPPVIGALSQIIGMFKKS